MNTTVVPAAVAMLPVRLAVSPTSVPPESVVPPVYWFCPVSVSVDPSVLMRLPPPVMSPANVRSLAPDTVSAASSTMALPRAMPVDPAWSVPGPATVRPPAPSAALLPAMIAPSARMVPPA
ncbi:hypothetical protein D3C72_1416060 [compost metagenome]